MTVFVDAHRQDSCLAENEDRKAAVKHYAFKDHGVSPIELKMLKQVSMLSKVAHPGHFIFILKAIRQAAIEL